MLLWLETLHCTSVCFGVSTSGSCASPWDTHTDVCASVCLPSILTQVTHPTILHHNGLLIQSWATHASLSRMKHLFVAKCTSQLFNSHFCLQSELETSDHNKVTSSLRNSRQYVCHCDTELDSSTLISSRKGNHCLWFWCLCCVHWSLVYYCLLFKIKGES